MSEDITSENKNNKMQRFFSGREAQISQPLVESAQVVLDKLNMSTTPLEAGQWLEVYNRARALSLNESSEKQLLTKVTSARNSTESDQWLAVYEKLVKIQETTKQNHFQNNMTTLFLLTGITGVAAGVVFSVPVVVPVGGFLIGAAAFKIVPDYVSKVIEKSSLKNLLLNGDDNNDDTET